MEMEGKILKHADKNERNQAAIKRVNDVLEDLTVVLNGVNLPTVEEINRIFVRLRDRERASVETEAESLQLNADDGRDLEYYEDFEGDNELKEVSKEDKKKKTKIRKERRLENHHKQWKQAVPSNRGKIGAISMYPQVTRKTRNEIHTNMCRTVSTRVRERNDRARVNGAEDL